VLSSSLTSAEPKLNQTEKEAVPDLRLPIEVERKPTKLTPAAAAVPRVAAATAAAAAATLNPKP